MKINIPENNRQILEELMAKGHDLKHMTYIELGLFLKKHGYTIDWASLGDAHDWLGGYENEKRDEKIKREIVNKLK